MAKPTDSRLTLKQYFFYKKYQIKKGYRESKKIFKKDMKENWKGYAIIAGGTFAGFLTLFFWVLYVNHKFNMEYGR
jgi:hypothetical protein